MAHIIPFLLFALTLLGIALWHRLALPMALGGLACLLLFQLTGSGVVGAAPLSGLLTHWHHEWVLLANLLGLLTGFALLANHFEQSGVPQWLPSVLPDDWTGGLVLLVLVFVLSAFLDNIAAAMIGGSVARVVFRGRVHVGYLCALVGAANGGGAGSVVGDTTTTMLWLSGIAPAELLRAYLPAVMALALFGTLTARAQQRFAPIQKDPERTPPIDVARLVICGGILLAAVLTNVVMNLHFAAWSARLPWMGLAVWLVLLVTAVWRQPDWRLLPEASRGAVFLLSLVLMASLLPVKALPTPTFFSTAALGFVSAVFDNIPLTKLAIEQGGYDWGLLAYAVGFGGSMMWFGSSAGVALCGLFPHGRRTRDWLRLGWSVPVAYVLGVLIYGLVW